MRILVTGATGFVGAHTVRALLEAGHHPVLFVRDPARIAPALEPLGVDPGGCEVVVGDVRDLTSVWRAVRRADALLHAANVYRLDGGDPVGLQRVNVDGTKTLLAAAAERGLAPLVHVSSTSALLPASRLTPDVPVGRPHGAYARSKAGAESVARRLQEQGAPVVVTNPAAVIGPHDPHLGPTTRPILDMVRGRLRTVYPAGLGFVDVRDVATAHARLFRDGRTAGRYLLGGHWVSLPEMYRHLAAATGRRLPRVRVPTGAVVSAGRLADRALRRGIDPGFSSELVWIQRHHPPFDDRATQRDLGVVWRPVRDSLRDLVAWSCAQGLVSPRQAGTAAAGAPAWSEAAA
jgi:dihydroflavonol-4-reductase